MCLGEASPDWTFLDKLDYEAKSGHGGGCAAHELNAHGGNVSATLIRGLVECTGTFTPFTYPLNRLAAQRPDDWDGDAGSWVSPVVSLSPCGPRTRAVLCVLGTRAGHTFSTESVHVPS